MSEIDVLNAKDEYKRLCGDYSETLRASIVHSTELRDALTASLSREAALVEALKWALPLADLALEAHRMERLRCGHDGEDFRFTKPNGARWVGLYQDEWDKREKANSVLSAN